MNGVHRLLEAAGLRRRKARALRGAAAETRLLRLEAITQTALSHLDLQDLLDELLDRIRDLLDADTAVMLLVEEGEEVLIPRATKGLEEELGAGVRIPIGQGFAGRVAARRTTIVIDEVETADIVNPILRDVGIRSLIGVPLLHLGEVIGVVHAGSYRPDFFDPEDGLLLQLAADRIALAITQSRLYEAEREARQEAETAHEQVSFLARASELLGSSFDVQWTLARLADLAVPTIADEVLIDIVSPEGELKRLAVADADPDKLERIREVERRYPPDRAASYGAGAAVRSGEPQLVAEITPEILDALSRDDEHRRLIEELGLHSFMSVPLAVRDHVLGVMTFISSTPGRAFGLENLFFAQELARRAATAIESAQLHAETEERARAALVLDHVGEGVFLVDRSGVVRLWNPAAEAVTGIGAADVVGRPAAEAIPGWGSIEDRVPVAASAARSELRPETLPLDVGGGREIWVLVSGVTFPEGTVYAFRDMTEERGLRELQTEFVATISHELRTPLAAVYGAAMTLQQRTELDDASRERLLAVVYDEAGRLSRIIDDVLWASRLESGRLDFSIQECRPQAIAESVVESAGVYLPPALGLELDVDENLPPIATDPDKVRQVLANLLDNAVKYSPDGGMIRLTIRTNGRYVRFAVRDEGLGIPASEHPRIFEKFYRVDPNQRLGVGGTGLGLYISRELVRRMSGRMWVESNEGRGSTFFIELPRSEADSAADVLAHVRDVPRRAGEGRRRAPPRA
ncbi:MAG TPA: GAF domain-containing protein [Gaiellaceae bacterium]|nr:GAF domain-containing protein [Gaiellaceae bacterium]HET8652638.1 GAF domain-containing protein [Gaiellaceae bacterium]